MISSTPIQLHRARIHTGIQPPPDQLTGNAIELPDEVFDIPIWTHPKVAPDRHVQVAHVRRPCQVKECSVVTPLLNSDKAEWVGHGAVRALIVVLLVVGFVVTYWWWIAAALGIAVLFCGSRTDSPSRCRRTIC